MLVFHEWIALFKDMAKAKSVKHAFQMAFGSPVDYHKTEMEKIKVKQAGVKK